MKIFKVYNFKNILKLSIFVLSLLVLLLFSKENFESVSSSTTLFITSILPSLFPFIFFTELVLNSNIVNILSNILGKITEKLLKISKNSTPAIIIGFLCGYPMGSKTVALYYENNKISKSDATKLLNFVNNCNPVFILSTIGISIFKDIKVGVVLLISHYISAIIIAFFTTIFNSSNIIHENELFSKSFEENQTKIKENNYSFFDVVKSSILKAFITLGNIFGFIIIFNLLFNVIKTLLLKFNVNITALSILSGLFEVTKGCNDVFKLNIDYTLKICVISFLLGFSGLCIICQVYSTISSHKFSFKSLIFSKLIHGILSFISTYIILKFTNFVYLDNVTAFKNIDKNITYSEFLNNISHTYINSIFLIIASLSIFSILYTIFHKDKRAS